LCSEHELNNYCAVFQNRAVSNLKEKCLQSKKIIAKAFREKRNFSQGSVKYCLKALVHKAHCEVKQLR